MGCSSSVDGVSPLSSESFFTQYELGARLGKGGFSQVRRVTCNKNGQEMAAKIMDLRTKSSKMSKIDDLETDDDKFDDAKAEAKVWRKVGEHRNIVSIRAAFFQESISIFVMEKAEMSLLTYLQNGAGAQEFHENALSRALADGLTACAHIHKANIVHRDIKPDNFVVQNSVVKMIDFGLAEFINKGVRGTYGTAPFMAPEMLAKERYNGSVDVWSMGVIAYVILFGAFPYMPEKQNREEMKNAIREGVPPAFEASLKVKGPAAAISDTAVSFTRALLNRDPASRPTAGDALKLEYVNQDLNAQADLPSLKPTLAAAVHVGAFDDRNPNGPDESLDELLERLQGQYVGEPTKPSIEACDVSIEVTDHSH